MRTYRGFEFQYEGRVRLSSKRLEWIYGAIEEAIDRVLECDEVILWHSFSRECGVPVSYLDRVAIRRVEEVAK